MELSDRLKLDGYIVNLFAAQGVDTDSLLMYIRADMSADGAFVDTHLAFSRTELYVISGYDRVSPRKGKKRLQATFEMQSFKRYPLGGKLVVERMFTLARLVLEQEGVLHECARFSLGHSGRMEVFARGFNGIASGEKQDIDEQLSQEELFCPKCSTRYPEPERKVCPHCLNRISLTKRLLAFFKFYKWKIALIVLMMTLSTAFNLLAPLVSTRMLVDDVLTPGGAMYGMVGQMILMIIGIRLLGMGVSVSYTYVIAGIVPWVIYDLKVRIFAAMQRLSLSFYTSKQTGSLMNRVNHDAENIYWFFVDGVPYTIVSSIMCLGVVGLMLWMDWQLSLALIVIVPLIVMIYRSLWSMFHRIHHLRWMRNARMSAMISDSLGGQRLIKAYAKEGDEIDRFSKLSMSVRAAELVQTNAGATVFPLIRLIMIFGEMVVWVMGGYKVLSGDMTLGTLLAFVAYVGLLYGPLDFFSWVSSWWARCMDAAQRVFEIMDSQSDVQEAEQPVRMPDMRGDIEVKQASFEYETGRPIIKEVSLSVKAGQMLGIVGKSGAGKTTIVNLMARLYDLKKGDIKIDGVPIKDIATEDLRTQIGIVSQEMYLFIGSIADNIRYARPDASMEEVIAAAKAASAHDFIVKRPDGYDTRIGTGGEELSGGEKQRLSIARAIIQNPRVLILDEATASMDTETERSIQLALGDLKQGRTTISIAHRLSTLRDADMLAVMDEGRIVETGMHLDLINKRDGEYAKLYKIQSEALRHIGVGE